MYERWEAWLNTIDKMETTRLIFRAWRDGDAEGCLRAVSENSKPIAGTNAKKRSTKIRKSQLKGWLKGLKGLKRKPFSHFSSDYQQE